MTSETSALAYASIDLGKARRAAAAKASSNETLLDVLTCSAVYRSWNVLSPEIRHAWGALHDKTRKRVLKNMRHPDHRGVGVRLRDSGELRCTHD